MKKIIGYTDSITECECCGKTELKGTFCVEIDGIELYYGSTCAFKEHGVTDEEQKAAVAKLKAEKKAAFEALTLEQMVSEATNLGAQRKVIAFIEKKGLDIRSFIEKHGKLVEETKFYFAYTYGSIGKTWMFDK